MAVQVASVTLRADVGGWFTGRDHERPAGRLGTPGNLAHRRPHLPSDLARDREEVSTVIGYPARAWHLLRQVHGASVAVVDDRVPPGAELRDVDAAVTRLTDRPLVVQAADCVPILLAGDGVVGVAHAGRRGVMANVVGAVVSVMTDQGSPPPTIHAAIGPAIGGCCYEVPADLQRQVGAVIPRAVASTTWGTPSLDLPAAVRTQLARAGVPAVTESGSCTHCDHRARWFSHRADPEAGRQAGIVVRRSSTGLSQATPKAGR